MNAREVVDWCADNGVGLTATPQGTIKIDCAAGSLRAQAVAKLVPVKQGVLAELLLRQVVAAQCGSPFCKGCYEVEPGVRLHPPRSLRGDGVTPDLVYRGRR